MMLPAMTTEVSANPKRSFSMGFVLKSVGTLPVHEGSPRVAVAVRSNDCERSHFVVSGSEDLRIGLFLGQFVSGVARGAISGHHDHGVAGRLIED